MAVCIGLILALIFGRCVGYNIIIYCVSQIRHMWAEADATNTIRLHVNI